MLLTDVVDVGKVPLFSLTDHVSNLTGVRLSGRLHQGAVSLQVGTGCTNKLEKGASSHFFQPITIYKISFFHSKPGPLGPKQNFSLGPFFLIIIIILHVLLLLLTQLNINQ